MERTNRVALAVLACVLVLTSGVAAQDHAKDLTTLSLEELLNLPVVTATRSTQGASTAPAHVEVVTALDIERRGYQSLVDVLRDLPGIKVDYAVDQDLFSDITIQGTRGTLRVVVLLDGIRIVSPTSEPVPMLANYPVHNAKQVEVVYGPASALYGADAFSAVINIITREPGQGLLGTPIPTSSSTFGIRTPAATPRHSGRSNRVSRSPAAFAPTTTAATTRCSIRASVSSRRSRRERR